MSASASTLQAALRCHQVGDLRQAEMLYLEVLRAEPNNADAHHLLGLVALSDGRVALAVEHLGRATQLNPKAADFHHHLGHALAAAGRISEAIESLAQAVARDPASAAAHNDLGRTLLDAGRRDEAAEHFRAAIHFAPHMAEAHSNLATVLAHQGHAQQALAALHEAVRLRPDLPGVQLNLGNCYESQGLLAEAEGAYRRAISLDAGMAAAHRNLGVVLERQNQHAQAAESLRHALCIEPNDAAARTSLGTALQALGQLDEAETEHRRAIALQPNLAIAHRNLGLVFEQQGKHADACASHRAALHANPDYVEAHLSLAVALQALGQLDEAEAHFRRALQLQPNSGHAALGLGTVLQMQRRFAEAEAAYQQAIHLTPEVADAHYNLALCLQVQNKSAEAQARYQQAIALEPDNAYLHFCLGCAWLADGDFGRGWPQFEWRLKTRYAVPPHPQPQWHGQELQGQSILVRGEGGFGDTLQFIRYVPLVQARGGDVVVEVQPGLMPLLSQSGYCQLTPRDANQPVECQWQIPLLSLPGAFGTTLDTIPAEVPYLQADPQLVETWAARLCEFSRFKVAIYWHGNVVWGKDRSIPLVAFQPLAGVPDATFISLQKHEGREELAAMSGRMAIVDFGDELDPPHRAFMDTAAIMTQLDLVITCDSAPAHLAGALGVPVWVALPLGSEWRWLRDRDDSPWYPTMRLFRETATGGWADVMHRMAAELIRLAPDQASWQRLRARATGRPSRAAH
jgi:tetratricopeptide (TPR) repeat protein